MSNVVPLRQNKVESLGDILDIHDIHYVSIRVGLNVATVRRLTKRREFPQPTTIPGLRGVRWNHAAVEKWVKKVCANPQSQYYPQVHAASEKHKRLDIEISRCLPLLISSYGLIYDEEEALEEKLDTTIREVFQEHLMRGVRKQD